MIDNRRKPKARLSCCQVPESSGPRVFAYLRASHPDHPDVLRALDALNCATVCFVPDAASASAALPASPHIHYSAEPVDLQLALAKCDLVICHAGQATVAQAMRFGIPCLLLPTQAEQFLLARQLERSDVCINAARVAQPVDYRALIAELTRPDGNGVAAAHRMAEKYRLFDPAALTTAIASAAEALAPAIT